MGLHSEVLKWLRASVAPRAFQIGVPFDWREAVVIDDALTRLRRLYNGAYKDEFTGAELFAKFAPLVWDIFRGGGKVYVCCCDITELVPAEKGREQASRDAAKEKYPPESEVCSEGIKIWMSAEDLQPFGYAQLLAPKRFNIQTLCGSRVQVREKMMQFLCDGFKAEQKRIPEGAAIIMDYSLEKKPVMITRDYIGPVLHHSTVPADYFQHPEKQPCIERRFGEADHALPFWCRVFAHRSRIYVLSVDSDVLANMATYVSTSDIDLLDREPAMAQFREVFEGLTGWSAGDVGRVVGQFLGHHKELIWVRPDFRPPGQRARIPFEQVDLLELYHRLLYKEMNERFPERKQSLGEGGAVNCTLFQFLALCAANGTDYVDKKDITNGLGADKVISAVLRHTNRYRINLPQLRGGTATLLRAIGAGMYQEMPASEVFKTMFPVGDYDPVYCSEADPGCVSLLYQPAIANKGFRILVPSDLMFGTYVFSGHAGLAWQLAYWLVNYTLFKPRQKTGDPVARYVRITSAAAAAAAKQPRQEKRRIEETADEQRPLKSAKTLVHTTCGGIED